MTSLSADALSSRSRLTRRQLLQHTLAAGAVAAGTPFLTPNPASARRQGSGKLTVGVYAYVPQGIPFDQVVQRYTEKYPDVQVDVQPMGVDITSDSSAFVQRMLAEAQAERSSYDLIVGPTTWIEVAPLAELGAIDSIEQYVPETLLADLYDPVRQGVTYADGQIYSLPWWADVVGFMYRKSMLQQALGADTPPATWDEVLQVAAALKTALPNIAPYGADWPQAHRLYLPILSTMTGNLYTEEGVWNTADPAFLTALELIQQLVPYMPASSQEDLGSSKAFQAGQVAMATYWPTQALRAIQAGQPAEDIMMTGNPRSTQPGTLFWNADIVMPKFSANKEEAGRFMNEALLSDFAVEKSYANWKVLPYKSINERYQASLPEWAQSLVATLSTGAPIPMNPYYLGFELPIYKEEVERMILQDQSPADTKSNLDSRIKEALQTYTS